MRGWVAGQVAASLFFVSAGWPASVTVPGSFLYRSNGGTGGIVVVDGSGNTYYQIVPRSGAGFDTTENFGNSIVQEFSQARNGTRIAFSSGHWGYIENDYQVTAIPSQRIFIMNADGTGVRQLSFHNPNAAQSESDYSPQVSPDGTKIAYIGGETIAPPGTISNNGADCSGQETQALWVMNADGSNAHVVRSTNWANDSYCNAGAAMEAAWSPDGTRLLVRDTFGSCYGNLEVGIMNADGSDYQNLSCIPANGGPNLGLDWSLDGTKVVALIGGSSSSFYQIWDVSSGTPVATTSMANTLPNGSNGIDMVRFSPDSTMVAIADVNNGGSIFVYDLNWNLITTINTLGHENMSGGYDAFWWSASSPGTLGSMTLGVPSVYVNACANYTVQLQPSTYNTAGTLLTHGFSSANVSITSGDGDSWYLDPFGPIQYSQTRESAAGTLQLTNFSAASNTVPLTVDSTCNCQAVGGSGLVVRRSGLRYVAGSLDQMVQTLTVTNSTGGAVSGPIDIVISNLSPAITLTNLSGTSGCASSGSPFMTALPSGSLAPGASVSVELIFRDPLLSGFTYATTVTTGFGAP
jgi:hypothetical protein